MGLHFLLSMTPLATMHCLLLQCMSVGVPATFIVAHFIISRDKVDLEQGLLGNNNVRYDAAVQI